MAAPDDPTRTVAPAAQAAPLSSGDTSPPTVGGPASCPLPAPALAGRYALGGELAHGGMGVVYRATDIVLGREVAVKVLRDTFGPDAGSIRRFNDEARISAQLQHPAIPPVHDLGLLPDGRPFLAMKLINGQTLDAMLRSRPEPGSDRGRFVAAFEQIAQAVGLAHSRGIIHRDLKPANVMVGSYGEVQVTDWGLAKELGAPTPGGPVRLDDAPEVDEQASPYQTTDHRPADGSTDRTQAGQVMGTPAYMPPEQARGEIDRVDRRSDVFGLGAILCEILTGKPPYVGPGTGALWEAVAADLAGAFGRLDACGADGELVAACKRCLSPSPEDRPADGGEVADLVADYRAGVESRLRESERQRTAAEVRAIEQRKRRQVQLGLAAAVGALLLAGGAAAWWRADQARAARHRQGRNADAVAALLDQCEGALRAGDSARAAVTLEAAQKRAVEGGAEDQASRLEHRRADLAMLRDLDAIDRFRWAPVRNKYPTSQLIADRIRAAFGRFGVTGDAPPVGETVAKVTGSAIRVRLVAALDEWLQTSPSAEVRAVLRAVDADPYRDAVRDANLARDGAKVTALARRPEALAQPAGFAVCLGMNERLPRGAGWVILTAARRGQPGNYQLLMTLGWALPIGSRASAGERVRYFQAAAALAPDNPATHHNLGLALRDRQNPGDVDDAVAAFREALRRDPNFHCSHNSLGNALNDQGDWDGAIVAFGRAIGLQPNDPYPRNGLGNALRMKGDLAGSIARYQEAIRLDPKYATARRNLGDAYYFKGDWDKAVAEYQEAIRLEPTNHDAHINLGLLWEKQGKLDDAITAYRAAIKADPSSRRAPQDARRAQRFRELLPRLADIAAGRAEPKSPAEGCELARLCGQPFVRRYVLAVRLYEQAFTADPKLATLELHHRYSAACYAALAVAGKDAGAAAVGAEKRGQLSDQARAWLLADLAQLKAQAADPRQRAFVHATLSHWKRDADLAPFRGRGDWAELWAEVDRAIVAAKPAGKP